MNLPDSDAAYLADRDIAHSVVAESGMICVVLPEWRLPTGYDRESADLLLRLHPGYPDAPPDMWWFDPAVQLSDGRTIEATQVIEQHVGRSWQRWSRHLQPSQWQSGVDGLESYLALVTQELARCANGATS